MKTLATLAAGLALGAGGYAIAQPPPVEPPPEAVQPPPVVDPPPILDPPPVRVLKADLRCRLHIEVGTRKVRLIRCR
jgi:hypothetical protein